MRRIDVQRREIHLEDYRKRNAREADFGTLITEPCTIYDGDRLAIVYLELATDPGAKTSLDALAAALPRVRFDKNSRSDGLISTSRTFGFAPRNPLRHDFCSTAEMAYGQPAEHAIIVHGAEIVSRFYEQYNAPLYTTHMTTVKEKILPEYHLEDEIFTSGIINENNPLKYHFDTGNIKNVWSGMLAFRNGTQGGYLSMPEYDIAIQIADRSLLLFDGQSILHGVTPIVKLRPDATRYSIVYYSLQQIWKCEPLDDEILRIRRLRTEREKQRKRKSPNLQRTAKREGGSTV